MKLVFDTNVILDVLTRREPFFDESFQAADSISRNDVTGAITANTVTDIFYLCRKYQPDASLRKQVIRGLLDTLEILDTTRSLCLTALDSPMGDYEDAVVAESAKAWSADFIVTRNAGDFTDSPVQAITPADLLVRLTS